MDAIWTEIVIKTPVGVLERAEAALHMATPLGLYIEDYSDLESSVQAFSGIDLIDDELINKDRGAALLHVYFQPGLNRAECAAVVRESMTRAGFSEIHAGGVFSGNELPGGAFSGNKLSGSAEYVFASAGGITEEDWADNWKRYFKPLRVGKGILIVPEWETPAPFGDPLLDGIKAVVKIDPGMAFGTGGHVTTRLCLELVEKCLENFANENIASKNMRPSADILDLGCGSGILSIASVLLGARSALGVDIDGYAARNAAENAARNGVADRARFITGNLFAGIDGQFDIIIANIVADVVIRLLQDAENHLRPGGALILSGIIAEREVEVMSEAVARGFYAEEARREEDWTALMLRQKTSHE